MGNAMRISVVYVIIHWWLMGATMWKSWDEVRTHTISIRVRLLGYLAMHDEI
jgi:hypothetical protein